jgi:hypothetical protein
VDALFLGLGLVQALAFGRDGRGAVAALEAGGCGFLLGADTRRGRGMGCMLIGGHGGSPLLKKP